VGGSTTTYNDTAVAVNTTYTYTVSAFDAAQNYSQPSNGLTVTTPGAPDTTAPSAPTSLSATATAYNNVDLSWGASSDNLGVTGYRIQRSTNGGAFVVVKQVGAVTGYSDNTVAGSTSYTYRVQALDAAGNVSQASNSASATTPVAPDTAAPTAPSGVKASAVSAAQVNLTWNASTDNVGVTAYDVYRATGGSSTFTLIATVAGTTRSYPSTGLTANTRYTYYVKARDAAGNVSAASNHANATTKPK
jgi:chitodextrinase